MSLILTLNLVFGPDTKDDSNHRQYREDDADNKVGHPEHGIQAFRIYSCHDNPVEIYLSERPEGMVGYPA